MKELSIEEKAKAYDEALKVLHKYDGANIMFTQDLKEEMFPELKESEDENIRKMVMKTFKLFAEKQSWVGHCLDDIDWDKCIAWLEKQGEQPKKNDVCNNCDQQGSCVSPCPMKLVEKQGEQKPVEPQQDMLSQEKYSRAVDECVYGEQKPANKVEPKFKNGDWVVSNEHPKCGNSLMRIVKVGLTDYLCRYCNGQTTYRCEFIDKSYHLWTIQDAKDGDVLYINNTVLESIMIYKSFINNGIINKYASYNKFGFEGEHYLSLNDGYIIPATKEQRDLLFQKIKEAGYEWDAKKKELKKIEQTSADETPYPETLEKAIDLYYYSYGNGEGEFEHLSLEKFRDIVHTFVSDYRQKPDWSEEDERMRSAIWNSLDMECLTANGITYEKVLDWMDSLKDRVLPQPKQEWSEEDDFMVENVRNNFGLHCIQMTDALREQYDKFFNKVKSLRPRPYWKPSEEQMKALSIAMCGVNDPLFSLYQDLNKLKEE